MAFLSFFPELLYFEAVERQAAVRRVNPLKSSTFQKFFDAAL
jgi:hypothetical protein